MFQKDGYGDGKGERMRENEKKEEDDGRGGGKRQERAVSKEQLRMLQLVLAAKVITCTAGQ